MDPLDNLGEGEGEPLPMDLLDNLGEGVVEGEPFPMDLLHNLGEGEGVVEGEGE